MLGFFRRIRKPKLVVHVGLPKCGSTTMQSYLADNAESLRAQGILYPETARETGGYRSHRPLCDLDAGQLAETLEQIAREGREMKPGPARKIILSCEAFSGLLPGGAASGLGAALGQVFELKTVSVLAYFRNPQRFAASAYGQFLVGGLLNVPKAEFFAQPPLGIDRFLQMAAVIKGFETYDYPAYIAAIETAFPGISLHLRSVERADLAGGDLLVDLCGVLGAASPLPAPAQNLRKSTSSLLALQFVQGELPVTRFGLQREKMRQFELSTAADWGAADLQHRDLNVGPELFDRIRAQMSGDRRALADRFATPIQGLSELSAPAGLSTRSLSAQEQAEVLAAFNAP